MDPRVKAIADGALQKLAAGGDPASPSETGLPSDLRIADMSLAQLSRLAFLQAGDPIVDRVLSMLKVGRPVFLDREAIERKLELDRYPPRVTEQFNRWFSRIAGYGVALVGTSQEPAAEQSPPQAIRTEPTRAAGAGTGPKTSVLPAPDSQILSEILGEASPEDHPCWIEPGKVCCGSGRCKTLGF
jgi:hypothetical protein